MSSAVQAFALPEDQWPDVSKIVTEDDTLNFGQAAGRGRRDCLLKSTHE